MAQFINPIPFGYLTSSFGWRNVNKYDGKGVVKDWHQGVDLSRQPNTNVQVVATADGEVYRVGTLGTYGKIVMIRHTVNGKRMDSVYAHLASSSVKVGQKVKQGQPIAIMGSTGGNWAIHLHFEIHNGAWTTGQPNAVDPAKYIKFYTKTEMNKLMQDLLNKIDAQSKTIDSLTKRVVELEKDIKNSAQYTSTAKADTYANEAIKWAETNGILKGDGKGNINAKGAVTRQDALLFLKRVFDLIAKQK